MASPQVVRHFSQAARDYGRFRAAWPLGSLRRQEQSLLRQAVHIRPADRLLDAGCGDGETMLWLAASGARPVGVDLTFQMAAHCHRRGLTVCVQDIEHLGMRAIFDWVLCIGSLEFANDPARAIASLAACLAPRGRFVLLFPRRGWAGFLYAAYHRTHGVRVHLFSRTEIGQMLAAAGLQRCDAFRNGWLSSLVVAQRR